MEIKPVDFTPMSIPTKIKISDEFFKVSIINIKTMIKITLKSGIVVEGTLATNQVPTKKPSVTVITNYPKITKTYKTNRSYTTGKKHVQGYDIVEYKSHEYIEKEVKQNTVAVIMEETIANREVVENMA